MIRIYVTVGLFVVATITAVLGAGAVEHALGNGFHILVVACSGHEVAKHIAGLIHPSGKKH